MRVFWENPVMIPGNLRKGDLSNGQNVYGRDDKALISGAIQGKFFGKIMSLDETLTKYEDKRMNEDHKQVLHIAHVTIQSAKE